MMLLLAELGQAESLAEAGHLHPPLGLHQPKSPRGQQQERLLARGAGHLHKVMRCVANTCMTSNTASRSLTVIIILCVECAGRCA